MERGEKWFSKLLKFFVGSYHKQVVDQDPREFFSDPFETRSKCRNFSCRNLKLKTFATKLSSLACLASFTRAVNEMYKYENGLNFVVNYFDYKNYFQSFSYNYSSICILPLLYKKPINVGILEIIRFYFRIFMQKSSLSGKFRQKLLAFFSN